ncbi:uncharacterized protein AB675_11982 [Cyphellophora attinorum]|uniref:Spindle pole body component n=1 Tax=Cyphellophora attinorum TaxID=1664694 RepID=A0A0N1NXV6_9EURO|nr:uncharacterized protein AB675_11982 [Phialophora attinorum]KPI38294.1 hypothetical protein AB675_11982 [Phialophora attinorum]
MLQQEILLALSGYQSDIFEKVKRTDQSDEGLNQVVSEPERAMLNVLGQIADLHVEIKTTAARIAGGHPSPICRGVAAAISDTHLVAFRKKIIAVEASILRRDAAYVGAYDIVPLSTIAGEFTPWTRRLRWLRNITHFAMNAEGSEPRTACSGKAMLDYLHSETRTGHSDLEELALSLEICAQKISMRSVAAWVLYGSLPTFGASDFMLQRKASATYGTAEATVDYALVPGFVTRQTAETILAIGNALNQIQAQLKTTAGAALSNVIKPSSLLPKHLKLLESLQYPLSTWLVQQAMNEIEISISQNALAAILPVNQVADFLEVIRRYSLLSEGEFATGLIEQAASKLASRQSKHASKPVRKMGRVDDLTIKDAELSSVLTKTWDELAAVQSSDIGDNKISKLARTLLVLRGINVSSTGSETSLSTLMPTATALSIDLPTDSNLRLFLQAQDIATYSRITSFLLSIRRAELQLAQLWKLTSQRRCHPTPIGPPISATPYGQQALTTRRTRENHRSKIMRQHWASTSKTLFVFNELDAYIHGEVIHHSWAAFQDWLGTGVNGSRPASSRSQGSRPGTGSSTTDALRSSGRPRQMNDPRTLASGHRAFLDALHAGLLLANSPLLTVLKEILNTIDHYVALFSQLSSIWQGLDLQEDEGVVDAFTNYKEDERNVLAEMTRCRTSLEEMIVGLVEKLKAAEHDRTASDLQTGFEALDMASSHAFVPWKVRTLDRLIMKLDYLTGANGQQDDGEGIMLDDNED